MKNSIFIIILFFVFHSIYAQTNNARDAYFDCRALKTFLESELLQHNIGSLDSITIIDQKLFFENCGSFKIHRSCKNCPDFFLSDSAFVDSTFVQISHNSLPKDVVDLFIPVPDEGIFANKARFLPNADDYGQYLIIADIILEEGIFSIYFNIPSRDLGGVLRYKTEGDNFVLVSGRIGQY